MPQETNYTSPCKNLRGLKSAVSNNEASYTEEIINDYELAQRKAEEAGNIALTNFPVCFTQKIIRKQKFSWKMSNPKKISISGFLLYISAFFMGFVWSYDIPHFRRENEK